MKKTIVYILSLTLLCNTKSRAQTQVKSNFTLKGSVKGLSSGKAILVRYDDFHRPLEQADTALIKNGHFILTGKVGAPELMSLQIKPGKWESKVFVENNVITVDADIADTEATRISGSTAQDQYNGFMNAPQNLKFKQQFAALNQKADGNGNERHLFIAHSLKEWQLQWIKDFAARNPSSTVGVYVFDIYNPFNSKMSLVEIEDLLSRFNGQAKKSIYYRVLMETLVNKKATSPGQLAPDFTLMQRDRTTLSLSSLRGKYVLIDFWASWCHYCRLAFPHWKEAYQKYKDKGFEIIGLSQDNEWNNWTKALDVEKTPWLQVIDEFPTKNIPKVARIYMSSGLPSYVLIDKEGIILLSGKEEDIDVKLKELFE